MMVGDRQEGREHGENAIFVNYDRRNIKAQVSVQMNHGKYQSDKRFGTGKAGHTIAKHLAEVDLNIKKKCTY